MAPNLEPNGSESGATRYDDRMNNPFQVTKPVDSSEVIDREAVCRS
jgi:hypothetical protein